MFERIMIITVMLLWIVMALGIIGWLGYVFVSWVVTGIMSLLFLV
ncbi:hypothetical protein [Limosilactobacillus mucosae]|nr:hypothetical protein [Limosilactobacillus mucosae]